MYTYTDPNRLIGQRNTSRRRAPRSYIHNGAKCHTANIVKASWMKANKMTAMEDFPSSSPDLNPIESLRGELNRRIAELMPHAEARCSQGVARDPQEGDQCSRALLPGQERCCLRRQ